jgi:predicted Zn-dependent protease
VHAGGLDIATCPLTRYPDVACVVKGKCGRVTLSMNTTKIQAKAFIAIASSLINRLASCTIPLMIAVALFLVFVVPHPADAAQSPRPARKKQITNAKSLEKMEKQQRAALASNPQSAELHGELGRTLLKQGKYEESTEELGLAANQLPDSRIYNMALVEALLGWGHWGVAVDFLNAVQTRFQQYPEFHYYLGLANLKLNKTAQALPAFETALRLNPKLDLAKFGLVASRAAIGDLQGAADLSRTLVKEHPGNARYWLALAQVLDSMGESNWTEALQASRRALALRPGDPVIKLKTAVILTHLGKYVAARPLLEQVVRVEPENLPAHVTLAGTYAHLGERALARKESEIVARLEKSKAEQTQDLSNHVPTSPNRP